MDTLTNLIAAAGYADRVFTERQLAELIGGGDPRRYGLVNRALKDGSLVRVKRGLYLLSPSHSSGNVHPFAIAQALMAGSYISFETALSFHGWIPETVFATASVTPGRKTLERDHDQLGRFTFHPLALTQYRRLSGVARVELGQRTALVAQPLRALMDLVALRKQCWSGLEWIEQGLRIDEVHLMALRRKDFAALAGVYKHKAANQYLESFEDAVFDLKSAARTGARQRAVGTT